MASKYIFIFPLLLLAPSNFIAFAPTDSLFGRSLQKNVIDTSILFSEIKQDVELVFAKKVSILSKDVTNMSQGNLELNKDLKDLYKTFDSHDITQTKLDALCKKWNFDQINI